MGKVSTTPKTNGLGQGARSAKPSAAKGNGRDPGGTTAALPSGNGTTPQRPSQDKAASNEQEQHDPWELCKDLATEPRILDRLVDELEAQGVVGEARGAKLIYLVLTSRLLERPISAAIKGPSSVGKSFMADRVLSFFPVSAAHRLSAMSEKALAYSKEPVKHRTIVFAEAAGLAGGTGAYLMRSLISEGQLSYETVQKGKDGLLHSELISREGPTNLLVTTTALKLDDELETRLLSIPVDDSAEQTQAIMLAHAAGFSGGKSDTKPDLSQWVALQQWLERSEHRVVIPFADELVAPIQPVAVRLRRDIAAILGLIAAHALLHQASRERDDQGRVFADPEDYAVVRELVADLVADGVGASVPRMVRETVEVVQATNGVAGLSQKQIAKRLKLDKSSVSRRISKAIEMGYLERKPLGDGRTQNIILADPLPDDVPLLPPVEALHSCSVARG